MIYDRLIEIIAEQFAVDKGGLSSETAFIDDLGADSLDVVELTMAIEAEFDLPEVPDEDLKTLLTVGDLAAYVGRFVSE